MRSSDSPGKEAPRAAFPLNWLAKWVYDLDHTQGRAELSDENRLAVLGLEAFRTLAVNGDFNRRLRKLHDKMVAEGRSNPERRIREFLLVSCRPFSATRKLGAKKRPVRTHNSKKLRRLAEAHNTAIYLNAKLMNIHGDMAPGTDSIRFLTKRLTDNSVPPASFHDEIAYKYDAYGVPHSERTMKLAQSRGIDVSKSYPALFPEKSRALPNPTLLGHFLQSFADALGVQIEQLSNEPTIRITEQNKYLDHLIARSKIYFNRVDVEFLATITTTVTGQPITASAVRKRATALKS